MMDILDPLIDQLTSPRGLKQIILLLIMLGYVLRMIPQIHNSYIPILNCFIFGPLLSFVLLGWPGEGEIDPNCRWPVIAAWTQAYQKGFMLGLCAWLGYGIVIKPIEVFLARNRISRDAPDGDNPATDQTKDLPTPSVPATPAG